MGSRDSWIDTEELAALGRQILGDPQDPAVASPGAATGEGVLPEAMIGRWQRQLADIRARAERSGLVGEGSPLTAPAAPVLEIFAPPSDGSIVTRMRAFEGWLDAEVRPRARFGCDDLGFPLLRAEGDPALVAVALSLCRSWHATGGKAMGAPSAVASSALDDHAILSVFPLVEGETFRFIAIVTDHPVGSEAAATISAAFRAAMG